MSPEQYGEELAKVADIDANVVVGCDPVVETFSRRAGLARNAGKRWGCIVCAALDWLALKLFREPNHCDSAVAAGEVE